VATVLLPYKYVPNPVHPPPLLEVEDLALIGSDGLANDGDELPLTVGPSISPAFTETLELPLYQGLIATTRRSLDLPNGLHFRKLDPL